MGKIEAFPGFYLNNNFGNCFESFPPFENGECFFYASGRAALYHVAEALFKKNAPTVLVPSFHCGVEVEAFKIAGFHVEFYNIHADLSVDMVDLTNKLSKRVSAILVIHYFGFPQKIDKIIDICRQQKIVLIEDCAHALFSANEKGWLGTFGNISTFSLPKTLPVTNGGVVLVENKTIRPKLVKPHISSASFKKLCKLVLPSAIRKTITYYRRIKKSTLIPNSKRLLNSNTQEEIGSYYYDELFSFKKGIDPFSKIIIKKVNFRRIIVNRQRNYLRLFKELNWRSNLKPLFKHFNKEICPLCFPVIVQDNEKFNEHLVKLNIKPFIFGKESHILLDKDKFTNLPFLRNQIIGLPIHQDLDNSDLDEIIAKVNSIF